MNLQGKIPMRDSERYNYATIRNLITDAFRSQDLRRFCLDRSSFRQVLKDFDLNPSLNSMTDSLIDYCDTHLLFPELLTEIKKCNPSQYEKYRTHLIISSKDKRPLLPAPPYTLHHALFRPELEWKQVIDKIRTQARTFERDDQKLLQIATVLDKEIRNCKHQEQEPFYETLIWNRCVDSITQLAGFSSQCERVSALAIDLKHELVELLINAAYRFYYRRDLQKCQMLIQQTQLIRSRSYKRIHKLESWIRTCEPSE